MPCEFKIGNNVYPCQFHGLYKEETLIKTEDGLYCALHLPLKYKEQLFAEEDFNNFQKQVKKIFADIMNSDDLDYDFEGVQFPRDVIAPKMNLSYCSFNKAVFHEISDFSHNQMFDSERPENSSIVRSISFDGAFFGGEADFTKITAFQGSSFCEAEFKSFVRFKDTRFHGHVDFSNAIFRDYANFSNAIYKKPKLKIKGIYNCTVTFDEAKFEGRSDFSESIFPEKTSFKNCQFGSKGKETSEKLSSFENARFGKEADFSECTFHFCTDFSRQLRGTDDEPDFETTDFTNTIFKDVVTFENRYFASKTSFRNTIFEKAPLIYNVVLNENVDFNGSMFSDLKSEDAHRTYEILKKHMTNNQREAAIKFGSSPD